MSVPTWIDPRQYMELRPPADLLETGKLRTRLAIKLVAGSLMVSTAKRYASFRNAAGILVTWCNVYLADVLAILGCPIPHWFDLGDGRGKREMRANDIVIGLRAGRFDGWSSLGNETEAVAWAGAGKPAVAVWLNPKGPGHVGLVVATPEGQHGAWIYAAGKTCVEDCAIDKSFGSHTNEVEFYGHD